MLKPSTARFHALRDIDVAAGQARLRYITDVPGQQAVYMMKLQEAEAFIAALALNASAVAPPHIAAEAAATGAAAATVATSVKTVATFWNGTLSPQIEGLRLGGKAAVAAAVGADESATLAAIESARTAAVEALDAI